MTKLPVNDQVNLTGLEGPEFPTYKVGPTCSTPFCNLFADHAHHIVRRSFLGGAYDWVRYPDGQVFQNLSGLCFLHHQHITENRSKITYEDGVFYWDNHVGDPDPLQTQPLTLEMSLAATDLVDDDHEHVDGGRRVCEGCGRPMPRPKIEKDPEEKKLRKTWAVMVPSDKHEDGADTLDALVEAARDELDRVGISYGNGSNVKFYPLTTALALFVQHSDAILSDGPSNK